MSYVMDLHEAHTARAARMGVIGRAPRLVRRVPLPPAEPTPEPAIIVPEPSRQAMPTARWARIVNDVLTRRQLRREDVFGASRKKEVVEGRNEIAFRLVVEMDMAFAAVGRRLNRDHTTIIHSVKQHVALHPEAQQALDAWRERQRHREDERDALALRLFRENIPPNTIAYQLGISRPRIARIVRESTDG